VSCNPLLDESAVIEEGQIAHLKPGGAANGGKFNSKLNVPIRHVRCATNAMTITGSSQPVSNTGDGGTSIVLVSANVLTAYIGAEDLVPILIPV